MTEPTTQRLTNVEHALAFAEHRSDQLSGELLKAFAEIDGLRRRIDALESMVRALREDVDSAAGPDDEPPEDDPDS